MRFTLALALFLAAGCGGTAARHVTDGGGGGPPDLSVRFADDGGPMQPCQPGDPPICEGDSVVKVCRADGSGFDSTPCPDATVCVGGVCRLRRGRSAK